MVDPVLNKSFRISLIEGNTQATPRDVPSFKELSQLIKNQDWAPGVFNGNYRTAANFSATEVLGLDFDEGMTLEEAKLAFQPYAHVIAPSRNHQKIKHPGTSSEQPARDRFRVVLRLSSPITSRDVFEATWRTVARDFPAADQAAKDCSRMFYQCGHDAVSVREDGKLVDPVQPEQRKHPAAVPPTSNGKKGELSRSTMSFLALGADRGEWNDSLFKAAKDCQENGYAMEEFVDRARRITGHLDEKDMATIKSAFRIEPKYGPRHGVDGNANLKEFVLRSHLITDIASRNSSMFVDLESGAIKKIDPKLLQVLLHKKELEDYLAHKQILASISYDPHGKSPVEQDEHGCYVYNGYDPPAWKRALFFKAEPIPVRADIPQIYRDYLMFLVGGHADSYAYLIDWLALSLQKRNLTILTAIGREGIGKGILGEIMEDLHGGKNFVKVRDTVFKEKFNAQLQNKSLVYVDEVDLKGKEEHDRIKDVINPMVEIEAKGVDAVSVPNYASFYLTSNHMDAVRPGPGDRRFSIIDLTETPLKDSNIWRGYPTINDYVQKCLRAPDNIAQLAEYLVHKKLECDMLKPFRSPRAEDVLEAGLAEWEVHFLQEWCPRNEGRTLLFDRVKNDIQAACNLRSAPGRSKLEDLSKKYPKVFRVFKGPDNKRHVEVFSQLVTTAGTQQSPTTPTANRPSQGDATASDQPNAPQEVPAGDDIMEALSSLDEKAGT